MTEFDRNLSQSVQISTREIKSLRVAVTFLVIAQILSNILIFTTFFGPAAACIESSLQVQQEQF